MDQAAVQPRTQTHNRCKKMSRPPLPAKVRRKSICITLSPPARKAGYKRAQKKGISLSELINRLLLESEP